MIDLIGRIDMAPPALRWERSQGAGCSGTAGWSSASLLWCLLGHHAPERPEHALAPPAAAVGHRLERLRHRQRRRIGPWVGQRIVDVQDSDDLCGERDLVSFESVGITAAVVALVVPADDRLQVPGKVDI